MQSESQGFIEMCQAEDHELFERGNQSDSDSLRQAPPPELCQEDPDLWPSLSQTLTQDMENELSNSLAEVAEAGARHP